MPRTGSKINTRSIAIALGAALMGGLIARAPVPEAFATRQNESAAVGTFDVYVVLQAQMSSESYTSERAQLTEQLSGQIDTVIAQLEGMGELLNLLDPQDPASQARVQEYEAKRAEYNQLSASAQGQVQVLYIDQLVKAYREVVSAAQVVGDEAGIEVLLASRDASADFDSKDNINVVLQDLLSRPVLTSPNGTDITDQVLDRMGLERPSSEPAAGEADGAEPAEGP